MSKISLSSRVPMHTVRLVLLLLIAAVLAAPDAHAQRVRQPPPEPTYTPLASAASVQALAQAVAYYERIVANGGWPKLPDRITLRPGDSDANVAILRRRLEASGEMRTRSPDPYTFDNVLEEAVKQYQLRNGLEPTGIVYGITQRSMNVSADIRLNQLRSNLARMSEVQAKTANQPRHILMNGASFELQAISNGRVEVVSRVISGKRATPTPVVSAQLQAINLLPYWHVPHTIAKAALVPAVRKDPAYLYKEKIRVFSSFGGEEVDPASVNWFGPEADRYVFRQDPGAHNALGVLRFDMPNKHIVYMHDTPMKNLFNYFERAYSAGCVRIQNFLALAEWLTGGQGGWTRPAIESAIAANQAKTIKLPAAVPVHFVYLTAWVDQGAIHFRNDLYNRDAGAFAAGETSAAPLSTSLAP